MLSAVVITKNEEESIGRCLKSLSFCDEVIIVDDCSVDNTIRIAKKFTQRIFKRKLANDFSGQRNYGIRKAKGEWILFVDADEIVSSLLKQEITRLLSPERSDGGQVKSLKQDKNLNFSGYFIKREDIFLGKKMRHGETGDIKLVRLGRRGKGRWVRPVHEVWDIRGKIGQLRTPLIHFSHNTVSGFLQKINYYSTINANYLFSQKVSGRAENIFIYPITKFTLNFLFKKGFLDGFEGFLLAVFMSFHSFLTRSKLYLLRHA